MSLQVRDLQWICASLDTLSKAHTAMHPLICGGKAIDAY